MNAKNKVYCKDCKYFEDVLEIFSVPTCFKVVGYEDTPFYKRKVRAKPNVNNKFNECVYHEEMMES